MRETGTAQKSCHSLRDIKFLTLNKSDYNLFNHKPLVSHYRCQRRHYKCPINDDDIDRRLFSRRLEKTTKMSVEKSRSETCIAGSGTKQTSNKGR